MQVYRPDTHSWPRFTAWDTMNACYTRRVDLIMQTRIQARRFGVQEGVIRQ